MCGVSQHHPQPGALDQEHPTPEAHSDPQGFNIQPFVPTQAAPHLALSSAHLLRVPFAPQGLPPPGPGPSQQSGPAPPPPASGFPAGVVMEACAERRPSPPSGTFLQPLVWGPRPSEPDLGQPGTGPAGAWGRGETSAAGQPGASSPDRRPRGHLSSSPCRPCPIGVLQGRGGGLGVRVGNGEAAWAPGPHLQLGRHVWGPGPWRRSFLEASSFRGRSGAGGNTDASHAQQVLGWELPLVGRAKTPAVDWPSGGHVT